MNGVSHRISSPSLRLRPITEGDVEALHHHWTDAAVRRYLWDDEIITRDLVDDLVDRSRRLFSERGYGLWRIDREQGVFVGCAGFWEFHEPPQLELVVSIAPEHQRRGWATEAATMLMDYGFETLGIEQVLASTDAPNQASLRLIDRLGFERLRRDEAQGRDTVFFGIRAPPSRPPTPRP